jgi:DNA-binding MarR family transcriptional regulator
LSKLDLFSSCRLNRLAAEVSNELAGEYRDRYGLDIPEWRVLATLGFRDEACTAQYIAYCTRTHKSTISRAVAHLLKQNLIERVENAEDRRELALQLTRKGRALYEELIPQLLRKEQDILSCLTALSARNSPLRLERSSAGLISCRARRKLALKRMLIKLELGVNHVK